jgi:cytoskeletal protein RodZ
MGTLGAYLITAREALGIDLHEAAQRTRISLQYLDALENENFTKLPGEVFVRGFLKNYARFLNVPEAEVMKLYGEITGAQPVIAPSAPRSTGPVTPVPCEPKKKEEMPLEPFVWGTALFIALIVLLFTSLPRRHAETPSPQTSSVSISPPAPGVVPGVQSEKLSLEIAAVEDAWVLVRIDSSPQKKAVLSKGESVTWIADERFLLSYNKIGAVKLTLNGKELLVTGPASAVVRDVVVTAAGIVNQKIQTAPAVVKPKAPAPPPQAPSTEAAAPQTAPAPVEAPAVPPPPLPNE